MQLEKFELPDGWEENENMSNSSGPMVASYIHDSGFLHVDVVESGPDQEDNFKVRLMQTGPSGGTTEINGSEANNYDEAKEEAKSMMRIGSMKIFLNDAD